MSRCVCNRIMTVQEMSRKDRDGEYEQLCTRCLQEAGVLGCEDEAEAYDVEADSD